MEDREASFCKPFQSLNINETTWSARMHASKQSRASIPDIHRNTKLRKASPSQKAPGSFSLVLASAHGHMARLDILPHRESHCCRMPHMVVQNRHGVRPILGTSKAHGVESNSRPFQSNIVCFGWLVASNIHTRAIQLESAWRGMLRSTHSQPVTFVRLSEVVYCKHRIRMLKFWYRNKESWILIVNLQVKFPIAVWRLFRIQMYENPVNWTASRVSFAFCCNSSDGDSLTRLLGDLGSSADMFPVYRSKFLSVDREEEPSAEGYLAGYSIPASLRINFDTLLRKLTGWSLVRLLLLLPRCAARDRSSPDFYALVWWALY